MQNRHSLLAKLAVLVAVSFAAFSCFHRKDDSKKDPSLADLADGRKPEDLAEIAFDVFKPMDGGIELTQDEIKGRNTWNLWCGGNEQFWDRMAREAYGLTDLLRMIDSRNRGARFKELGLINQPGYKQATKADQHGLWIDEAVEPEPSAIDPKVYGRATGVMGFRLFDNPDFKGDAVKSWDANRYYTDLDYAADPKLVRPYRVGASCGSCHIAFNPVNPPADPENPRWENLASAIGNQYIREGRVFAHTVREGGFFWEMLKAQPPGTSDTSRIATDHINNPNTINPIFLLKERLDKAPEEVVVDDGLNLPTVKSPMKAPHVLKDGADSVGVPGATLRVYVNIGSYSQHWLKQHNPLIGLTEQKPFSVKTAQENSVYWLATQQKFENIAKFFMRLESFRLEDAPGGSAYIDQKSLGRGKIVFAQNCAQCHSSKRPPAGVNELDWFRDEVVKPDFRTNNFFSDDKRYPVTIIKTNASRACATNAKRGHIWDSFSSETYKNLPAVGDIEVWNPYTGLTENFSVPGGGTGYYRTPSLISVWSSAPLLHNNALGVFNGDPSVKGRMDAFNDAITKLLWPERRLGKESIWRTSRECQLQLQLAVIPGPLRALLQRHADPDGYFRIGYIPAGTPINLIANIGPEMGLEEFVRLSLKLKAALLEVKQKRLNAAATTELLRQKIAPELFKVNNCPDLIEDRGHEFGVSLPDADKRALIEFLKTL
jgi:hypothetical protein